MSNEKHTYRFLNCMLEQCVNLVTKKADTPVKFLLKHMFSYIEDIFWKKPLKFHKCIAPQEQNENLLFPCSINSTGSSLQLG